MADIFLSYQRDDFELARRVQSALVAEGFTVWWDDALTPREQWDRTIEREIRDAGAVLVLWTPTAVQSDWVRIEANYGRNCKPSKLVQARFSACEIPIAFSLTQYADLDRDDPRASPGWRKLCEWVLAARQVEGQSPPVSDLYVGESAPEASAEPRRTRSRDEDRRRSHGRRSKGRARLLLPLLDDDRPLPSPHPRVLAMWLALAVGASLMLKLGSPTALQQGFDLDPELLARSPIAAYAIPAALGLRFSRALRRWQGVLFAVAVFGAHTVATTVGGALFGQGLTIGAYARAGFVGGLVGSVISLMALSVLRRESREESPFAFTVFYSLGLGICGAGLLSAGFLALGPHPAVAGLATALGLYLPWQAAFSYGVFLIATDRHGQWIPGIGRFWSK